MQPIVNEGCEHQDGKTQEVPGQGESQSAKWRAKENEIWGINDVLPACWPSRLAEGEDDSPGQSRGRGGEYDIVVSIDAQSHEMYRAPHRASLEPQDAVS